LNEGPNKAPTLARVKDAGLEFKIGVLEGFRNRKYEKH